MSWPAITLIPLLKSFSPRDYMGIEKISELFAKVGIINVNMKIRKKINEVCFSFIIISF